MIGSGSAFSGLLRGAHMADQANMAQQQMQMQQEQFDMLKKQFQQERMDRAKQDAFKAVWAAKQFGDWNELKQLPQRYNDLFADEEIRRLNEDDIFSFMPDGTKALNPQTRRAFEQQTGVKLPTNEEEAIEYLRTYGGKLKDLRSGIESFVTPSQIAAGFGPGYRVFEQSMLQQMAGKPEKLDNMEKIELLKELVSRPDASPAAYSMLRELRSKEGTLKDMAREDLLNLPMSQSIMDKVDKGLPLSNNERNFINTLYTMQTDAGYDFKDPRGIKGLLTQVTTLGQLYDTVKNTDFASGMTDNAIVDMMKYVSSDKFKQLPVEEQRKMLQTISTRSGVGTQAAQFLKALSGTAVSDEEFQRIMENLTGGDIKAINKEALLSALSGTVGTLSDQVKSDIRLIEPYYAGSKAKLWDTFIGLQNPTLPKVTDGGTADPKELFRKEIRDQLKEAEGLSAASVGGVIDSIKEKGIDFLGGVMTEIDVPDSLTDYSSDISKLKTKEDIVNWYGNNFRDMTKKQRKEFKQYIENKFGGN